MYLFVNKILTFDEKSLCFVHVVTADHGEIDPRVISTQKLKAGLRRDEVNYTTTLIVIKPNKYELVSGVVVKVLGYYSDVMSLELLRTLPPHRGIDHKIQLELGMKPPIQSTI